MKLGVVGLPNVGKSTLFNAITKAGAECANYPFCTIEPNVGVVPVPDVRLDVLTQIYNAKKTTPAVLEFVDIAGLVKGAAKGEGLGNKFLSHIREVDAIVHVVRCFENPDIIHVEGRVDPSQDIATINIELILADLESAEKRLLKAEKGARSGDKQSYEEFELLKRVKNQLELGLPASALRLEERERELLKTFFLITAKPVIYAANIDEEEIGRPHNKYVQAVHEIAAQNNEQVMVISARIESELAGLDAQERALFMSDLGLEHSGLDNLIQAGYATLGLISYLTAGEKEVRAWTIERGTKAPRAAGKIHSDFERGFIRAEVVTFDDLAALKSLSAAREKGKVRSEGKDYVVNDGDVILFRFNV